MGTTSTSRKVLDVSYTTDAGKTSFAINPINGPFISELASKWRELYSVWLAVEDLKWPNILPVTIDHAAFLAWQAEGGDWEHDPELPIAEGLRRDILAGLHWRYQDSVEAGDEDED